MSQTAHVEIPAEFRIFLACRREQRGEKINVRDAFFFDKSASCGRVVGVEHRIRTRTCEHRVLVADIARPDAIVAMNLAERECELDSDLSARAHDENF